MDWKPPENASLMQGAVRLGQVVHVGGLTNSAHEDVVNDTVSMPLLVSSIPGNKHLVVKASGAQRDRAFSLIQSVMFRLMTSVPAGQLQFTFVDPIGLGQNVAAFMQLRDYHDALINSKAWTESGHIERYLGLLAEEMEEMVQGKLRNKFEDIEHYNAESNIREPYRVLVVLDFPHNFTEIAARRLLSIAVNGPRCGFYTVVHCDPTLEMPPGFKLDDLTRNASVWTRGDGSFTTEDPMYTQGGLVVSFDGPPSNALADHLLEAIGTAAANAQNVSISFEVPDTQTWWTGDTSKDLTVELGSKGPSKRQEMVLGKNTAIHALVAGKTGSGKSTLLHTVIMGLALNNHPEDLQLYLVDFKKGVEFKPYATYRLPHARVIAVESEREFGLSALQGLDAEMNRRGVLFRQAQEEVGRKVDDLPAYRAETGRKLPRILLIVDEFQEFFAEDDRTAAQAAQILERLVRQGRGFGIHVLLGSQTLAGAYTLARSTIDQMGVRIALQCSEADSRLILADDNPAARRLVRPGQAIYNDENGTIEGNEEFQVFNLDDNVQLDLLSQLKALAAAKSYQIPKQHIFEGDALADVTENIPLANAIAAVEWATSTPRSVSAWLGDPIAIQDALAVSFKPQSGNNLLIVGQDESAALGCISAVLMSLATQVPPRTGASDVVFYVLDFTPVDGDLGDFFRSRTANLPQEKVVVRRPQLTRVVDAVASEVKRRLENESASGVYPQVFLVVHGLQRARDLRMDDMMTGPLAGLSDDASAPAAIPAEQFATIIRDGPDVGVHTIVWCDTMNNLHRTLDRRVQREFTMKIAFQMSVEDSVALLDSPVAGKLGQNRAYFVSEDEGRQEKFRPYGLPGQAWTDELGARLQRRPRP